MRSEAEIREALAFFAFLLSDTSHAGSDKHVLLAEKLFECLSWVLKEESGGLFGGMIAEFQEKFDSVTEACLRAQRQ